MGRPPIGDRAITGTERARRSRARHRQPAPPIEPTHRTADAELHAVCRRCIVAYENLVGNPRYVEFILHPSRAADTVSSERHTEAYAAFTELKHLLRRPP